MSETPSNPNALLEEGAALEQDPNEVDPYVDGLGTETADDAPPEEEQ